MPELTDPARLSADTHLVQDVFPIQLVVRQVQFGILGIRRSGYFELEVGTQTKEGTSRLTSRFFLDAGGGAVSIRESA